MRAQLIIFATAALLALWPLQPILADIGYSNSNDMDLPSALDDDLFNDLPFEQRRQALREEVERNPNQNAPSLSDPHRYNLLIR